MKVIQVSELCMGGSRGGGGTGGSGPPPLKNHENIAFLTNTGLDPQENHTATKPAPADGPLSVRQRNTILMAFCCWADDGVL